MQEGADLNSQFEENEVIVGNHDADLVDDNYEEEHKEEYEVDMLDYSRVLGQPSPIQAQD